MKIPIRTLSPQDAEILARTTVTGVVSNGCVERHGLRWRSDALRTWEVSQRALGNKPEVTIRIDELDLSVVYVEVDDGSIKTIKATSTQPMYTQHLSLYEHKKLKKEAKKLQLEDRLVQMEDEEAFNLRIKYYAELGHADDPVAYKRLVGLRDQLAALRANSPNTVGTATPLPGPNTTAKAVKSAKHRERKAGADHTPSERVPPHPADPNPADENSPSPATPLTPADADPSARPRIFIKRKPK